jgi:SP family sugar:H+ symporter-like MFS transporter
MILQSFQQLTGANYFFYYGATIFQSVGITDSFVTQIILGAVNVICTFGGLYVLQRVGSSQNLSQESFSNSPFIIVRPPTTADTWWDMAIHLALCVCSSRHG